MKNSTLNALAQFSRNEKDLTNDVLRGTEKDSEELVPRANTVQNILNYSRALSVRKSRNISNIFMVLN